MSGGTKQQFKQFMVAAVIVVLASAVVGILACVPNIRKLRHSAGLSAVELVQEPLVNRAAVAVHPPPVEVQGTCQKHHSLQIGRAHV